MAFVSAIVPQGNDTVLEWLLTYGKRYYSVTPEDHVPMFIV